MAQRLTALNLALIPYIHLCNVVLNLIGFGLVLSNHSTEPVIAGLSAFLALVISAASRRLASTGLLGSVLGLTGLITSLMGPDKGLLVCIICLGLYSAVDTLLVVGTRASIEPPTVAAVGESSSLDESPAITSERFLSMLDELERAGITLTGSSTSLAATAREQEASIAEQAAAATQIMATSRQINATSQELATTMEEVAVTADEASKLANGGQEVLARMQKTMGQVVAASTGVAAKLSTLNEKASKIGSVVTAIAKVADQTNLLSLNAAIEAEKAGEFGRGFGVVATEIRRLADQTAVAALDIEHMIREMLTAVSAGVMGMEKFSEDVRHSALTADEVVEQLGLIIAQVQVMTERFDQVNYGMKSQAQGAEQITDSMRQLTEAAHQSANSIKDFNSAIQSLQSATQQLARTVASGRDETLAVQ